MSRRPVVGLCWATPQKEATFATCICDWAFRAQLADSRVFVFDINAGRPYNQAEGKKISGTGPLARKALREYGVHSVHILVDRDAENIVALREEFRESKVLPGFFPTACRHETRIFRGNNEKFVPTIPRLISSWGVDPARATGLVIADTNGLKIPIAALSTVFEQTPGMDALIHITYRTWPYWKAHEGDPSFPRFQPTGDGTTIESIDDVFRLGRKHWLVTEPYGPGRRHLLLYGSNNRLRPLTDCPGRLPLFLVESSEGREVLVELRNLRGAPKRRTA